MAHIWREGDVMTQDERRNWLHILVSTLNNNVVNEIANVVASDISLGRKPKQIEKLLAVLNDLLDRLRQMNDIESIPTELLPYLKRAILEERLYRANRIEESRARVSDPDTIEELKQQLAPYDEIMSQDWFRQTEAARIPHVSDFLTVERTEFHLRGRDQQERQYDEKFHILQAPGLFLPDLDHYRKRCGMRDVRLVVAFMDIDNFKGFNSDYGETCIDLHLLPRFMRALEAHVFARGFAYRFGGDEYAALLPNADATTGSHILWDFQRRLERINYQEIHRNPTVSIGFCEVARDCHFTNQELLQFAESAKNFAKKSGKNCIATFEGPSYTELCSIQCPAAEPNR
jgi:diguanylate cyclase (GGDEF)-like protein